MRTSHVTLLALCALLAVRAPLGADEKGKADSQSQSATSRRLTEIDGRSIEDWIKLAKDPDPSVRVNAIQTLTRFGKDAQVAGPVLIDRLGNDNDTSVRVNAAIALAGIGVEEKDAAKAVSELSLRMRNDQQAVVRLNAAAALAQFGKDAKPAIPDLVTRVKDQSSYEIRRNVVLALRAAAYDKEKGPDMRAVNALCYLVLQQNEPTAQVRLAAAMAIGSLGRPSLPADQRSVEQTLLRALGDKDKTIVIWSYVALLAINDTVDEKHLIALAKFLKNNTVPVRNHAARALGTIGTRAKSRIPDLIEAIQDKEDSVAAGAAWALGEMKSSVEKYLPDIAKLLKDPERHIRLHAAQALGTIGERASARTPDLIATLQDKDPIVVTAAAWAIGQMGEPSEKVLLDLAALLKHEEIYVRTQAVQTLGSMGAKAKSRVPNLIDTLQDKDPVVATGAAWALGQIGEAAGAAVPALENVKSAKGIDEGFREMAKDSLDKIRGGGKTKE